MDCEQNTLTYYSTDTLRLKGDLNWKKDSNAEYYWCEFEEKELDRVPCYGYTASFISTSQVTIEYKKFRATESGIQKAELNLHRKPF